MKRIISLMLTLAVALSLLILPAGAASTPEEALGEVNIYSGGYSMNYLAVNGRVQTQSYIRTLYSLALSVCYLHHPEIPPKGLCLTGTQGQAEAGQANRCGGCTSAADDPSDPVYRCVLSGQ